MSHYNTRVSADQQYQLIMECRNSGQITSGVRSTEADGYVLLYKRLSVSRGRYRWLRKSYEAKSITYGNTVLDFDTLLKNLRYHSSCRSGILPLPDIISQPITIGIQGISLTVTDTLIIIV